MAEVLSDYLKKVGNYSTILKYEFTAENRTFGNAARMLYFSNRHFESMYYTLFYAASNSSLILARGKLVLKVKSQTLGAHVSKKVLGHLKATVTGQLLQIPLKSFATFVGAALDLVDLKRSIQNRSRIAQSKKKRFREKLKLLALLVGKSKAPINPHGWQVVALGNYDRYEHGRAQYERMIIKDLLFKGAPNDRTPRIRRG